MLNASGNKLLTDLQRIFFQLLVFLIPTQLAKHFWPDWSLVWGIRVDYLAPKIYLTDLLILSILVLWLIEILVEREKINKNLKKYGRICLYVLSGVVVFIFVNIFFSSHREVNILKWVKIFELGLLSLYIATSNINYKRWFLKPLILSVIFFSILALLQFMNQRTLGGIMYYFGEREFNSETPGIALVNVAGRSYMRSYSTFGHPNALAGYLLVVIILVVDSIRRKIYLSKLIYAALGLSLVGLLLTFSKTVIVTLFILIVLLFITERMDLSKRKLFSGLLLLITVLSLSSPIIYKNVFKLNILISENIINRVELSSLSAELLKSSPIIGIGLNNFITSIPELSTRYSISWWLQPVHNITLLVVTATGLFGLITFVFVIYKAIINAVKYNGVFAWALIAILLTGLLDHYWLTLQQNMILMFIVLGLAFRKEVLVKNSNN